METCFSPYYGGIKSLIEYVSVLVLILYGQQTRSYIYMLNLLHTSRTRATPTHRLGLYDIISRHFSADNNHGLADDLTSGMLKTFTFYFFSTIYSIKEIAFNTVSGRVSW